MGRSPGKLAPGGAPSGEEGEALGERRCRQDGLGIAGRDGLLGVLVSAGAGMKIVPLSQYSLELTVSLEYNPRHA